ncbi:hypothetical protein GCM10028791_14870 [Echinicola sediminis]
MKRKAVKNIVLGALMLTALVSSISIKKLDEVRALADQKKFDAVAYARDFWDNELQPNLGEAVEINQLVALLKNQPKKAFEDYSKSMGIGNIRFFMISGKGEIRQVGEDELTVLVKTDSSSQVVQIETEYIFGNAVRDASGKVDLEKFEQTMDFNNVSAAINQLVRDEVLPPLKSKAEVGQEIAFVGAVEMNREQVDLSKVELIPVSFELMDQQENTAYAGR